MKPAWMILICFGMTLAQRPGVTQRDSYSGLIVGQVLDAGSGRPLGGVVVEITGTSLDASEADRSPTPLPSSTPLQRFAAATQEYPAIVTGSDGRFVVRELPAARYTITARKAGYLDGAYGRRRPGGASQSLLSGDGQKSGGVRLYLWRHASISGLVVDEAGEVVVGIPIRAMRRTMVAGQRRFVYTGVPGWTDDRGIYRIGRLPPGDYVVAAAATQVSVPAATAEEMRQAGGSSVAIDEIGASIAAGAGSIRLADSILTLGRSATGPPPSSDARVFVYPTTFFPDTTNPSRAEVIAVASGEDRDGIDLHLRPVPTRRVAGVLTSPDGQVAGIPIRLVPEDIEESPIDLDVASTVTNRQGGFTFPAVPVGHYLVQAIKGLPPLDSTTFTLGSGERLSSRERAASRSPFAFGRWPILWASFPLAVGRDDIANLPVRLMPALRVTGTAEFDGTMGRPTAVRLGQVPLVAEPASETSRVPATSGRIDAQGRWSLHGLPAGKYVLRIGPAPPGWHVRSAMHNGRDVTDAPLDLQADVEGIVVTFTDRISEVSGTVRRAAGEGDGDATVLVFPSDPQLWTTWGMHGKRFRSERVTQEGAFRITSLPPGDYYIIAIPDEQSAEWQDAAMLNALSRLASTLSVSEGEKITQALQVREVR